MTQFFEWIIDFFTTISSIIQHIFTAIIQLYNILIVAISTYSSALLSIPVWLRLYGGITLTVCALYLVVGRNSGK